MKVTLSISLCAFVVLLQLMQTPVAQYCSAPSCASGGSVDKSCQCYGSSASTCPSGFKPVMNGHNLCSCEKRTTPQCKSGTLDRYSCQCTIDTAPTCPHGSSITPKSARCTGSSEPICPSGSSLYGCECIKEYVRECDSGELSWNGCKCTSSSTPKCSVGCELNKGRCTCDGDTGVRCYSSTDCSGSNTIESTAGECCDLHRRPHVEQFGPQLIPIDGGGGGGGRRGVGSYRIGYGQCYRCY